MNTIEIDDQVFAELARRATGFHATPNDVLRRILELPARTLQLPSESQPRPRVLANTIAEFIRSERFQRNRQAVDRYLAILGWLHSVQPSEFGEVALKFRRGARAYFAKSEKEILHSGDGVSARQIPQSPFWALTTLDNKTKRLALEGVLQELGYSSIDINLVLAELPDSGIRRNHSRSQFLSGI